MMKKKEKGLEEALWDGVTLVGAFVVVVVLTGWPWWWLVFGVLAAGIVH